MDAPGRLADTIAAHLNLKLEDKQEVLEIDDAQARIEHVMRQLENEIDVLQIEKKIRTRARSISPRPRMRSEEHTSELQSLMRISYAVFCLKKKTQSKQTNPQTRT